MNVFDAIVQRKILDYLWFFDAKLKIIAIVNMFQIDRGTYGIFRKFLTIGLQHSHVKAYLDFMVDVAVIFGADRTDAEYELLESLRFEMELAKVLKTTQFPKSSILKMCLFFVRISR